MAELKVKISADTAGFTQGMNFTKAEVQAWNRVLKDESAKSAKAVESNYAAAFVGIAGAAALAGAGIKQSLDFAGHMQDMTDRTGISSEFLQQVGLEAKLAGSSVESVVGLMEKLAKNSQEALGGNEDMQATFERMGVSMEDMEKGSLEDLFKQVREHMRDTKLDAESIADLLKVGGKGAGELIPMLRGGDAGSQGISTDDSIARLDALGDKFTELWGIVKKGIRDITDKTIFPVMDFLTFGRMSRDLAKSKEQKTGEEVMKTSARAEADEKKKQAAEDKKAQKEKEQHAEKIAKLQEQVNKSVRDYNFSRLKTDDDRIDFLEKEQEKLQAITNDFSKPEEDRLKAQEEMNKKQQEIDKFKDNQFNKALDDLGLGEADKLFKPKKDNDALTSVGNFLGTDPNSEVNRELRESKDLLREIRNNTKPPITGETYPT
jgi:hypothetical protein